MSIIPTRTIKPTHARTNTRGIRRVSYNGDGAALGCACEGPLLYKLLRSDGEKQSSGARRDLRRGERLKEKQIK